MFMKRFSVLCGFCGRDFDEEHTYYSVSDFVEANSTNGGPTRCSSCGRLPDLTLVKSPRWGVRCDKCGVGWGMTAPTQDEVLGLAISQSYWEKLGSRVYCQDCGWEVWNCVSGRFSPVTGA